jgi:hypothetical protein
MAIGKYGDSRGGVLRNRKQAGEDETSLGGMPNETLRNTGYGATGPVLSGQVLSGPQETIGRNENDVQAEIIKQGKYQDETGMHDIHAGEGTQKVESFGSTLGNLGHAIGNTLGAGINVIHTGLKKAVNAIGGFFKKLFGKKKKKK